MLILKTLAPTGFRGFGLNTGTPSRSSWAIVAVVLLIACANLANFLLARAFARERETATRLALGSSRGRIIRQNLLEALLLTLSGGLLGLGLAFTATRALIAFVARGATYVPLDASPDSAILLFTLGVSIFAGLLFGLAPALHVARASAMPAMNATTRTAASRAVDVPAAGGPKHWLRRKSPRRALMRR